ncbi:RNA-directed DNA polymerase, eukaryota [Tanacetum coccineum]
MEDGNWKSYRSKEDQTQSISQSFFVTNFPDHVMSRDFWKVCNDYGVVVDDFIPYKKSKAGKRFAFVQFIKFDNIDRLVANLCAIWIGRFHLHENVARFHRECKTYAPSHPSNANVRNSPGSFVFILKSDKTNYIMSHQVIPFLILDDSCISDRDFCLSLMGKVKDITTMPNLYVILEKEGLHNLTLAYLGGLWVLIETVSTSTKNKILNHTGVPLKCGPVIHLLKWHLNGVILLNGRIYLKNLYFETKACDPFICNDTYESESSDDDEDADDEGLQSRYKVTSDNDVERVARSSYSGDDLKYPPGFKPSMINVEEVNEKEKWATSNEETKMESMELVIINTLWGNSSFNYALSSFLGNSATDGMEIVLIDLPLDGYTYTWAHKTAIKMSKLDRFLISKGLLSSFPFLLALCLDRYLSNHHHVLMRELSIYYVPAPFRLFHSWFNLDGFDKMVKDTSKSLVTVDSNGMINLKKKLQALKIIIKQCTNNAMKISYKAKISVQSKLSDIDKILDQGDSNEEILSNRSLLLKELNDINSIDSLEAAQKSSLGYRSLDCETNKSPSPDGFTFEFFRRYWKHLEHDIVAAVENFLLQHKKIKAMVFKVDFEKAFDSIRWDYLQDVLKMFDFGHKWCGWINGCLNSAIGSVLVNGTPTSDSFGSVEALGIDKKKLFNRVDGSKRKMAWINWNKVIPSKKYSGLGVSSNGLNTLFWDDPWLDDLALKHKLPRLYALDNYKQITFGKKIDHASMVDTFRLPPRGGAEEEQLGFLLSRIGGLILTNISNCWVWSLEDADEFLFKSVRQLLDDSILPNEEIATRRVKVMPIKINVFAWRVRLDKLSTRLNLSLKGIDISTIVCPLCHAFVESGSHIFFSCPMVRQLWRKLMRCWELENIDLASYDDWLLWLNSSRFSKRLKEILEGVCSVKWWLI